MKIRVFEKEQAACLPLIGCTCNIDYLQEPIMNRQGFYAHQIFTVSSGSGVLKVGEQTYILGENDMFFLEAGLRHTYYGTDGSFRTSFLAFMGSGFEGLQKYYKLGNHAVFRAKSKGRFLHELAQIFDAFDTEPSLPAFSALTYAAVITFFEEACQEEASPLEQVRQYLERNYAKPIALEDILQYYPASKSKLCRDFKEAYGTTIFQMLLRYRLRRARYLLQSAPYMKLAEVALSCGFQDVSYFCRMYKRQYGHSPKGR